MGDNQVTGGDIHKLWMTAHMDISAVEDAYIKLTEQLDGDVAEGDEGKYGKAFDSWNIYREIVQLALFRTAVSARATRLALDLAVSEFTFVDGDAANGITDAGKEFLEAVGDENQTPPEYVVEPEGDPVAPLGNDE
ncbi:hypothetical protein [Stackebrandtia nassauensis]|uniref:Uncharacterized protein n=1 Tax=Stackebrandtia nassauensis (strain DSM 44728 / CIP 108903 / NRRL B-16338 / NBRC 102104 / LLR-40K-21) TaxID=446470 RepID=D3PV44_STANL|nr:hypothetical protein [Stackebrandtia nassauensis]ADD41097.1 hypothetical protein Snas_1390 [Stackebrandtia nassauensis DSM 44728]